MTAVDPYWVSTGGINGPVADIPDGSVGGTTDRRGNLAYTAGIYCGKFGWDITATYHMFANADCNAVMPVSCEIC